MGSLALRFEKHNLGNDLRLGVVTRVCQVQDESGGFPDNPRDLEVVIPAGTQTTRTIDDLPAGTYRIEARLPSGQVLRETRRVGNDPQAVNVVFGSEHSPHEWLSWQRLAGNVPSQAEYEAWVNRIAEQINTAAKATADAARPIHIDAETARGWARMLHTAHLAVDPLVQVIGGLFAKEEPKLPGAAAAQAEFEVLQVEPASVPQMWDAVKSLPAWTDWRKAARVDAALNVDRIDDRQVTLWRIAQGDRTRYDITDSGGSVPVRSLAVLQRGGGVDVIPLPVPWPLNPDSPAAPLEILREAGVAASGRTTLTVRDESVGSLLMYLGNGRMADAAAVLAEAGPDALIEKLVASKFDNPFAACAAAYVGLATLGGETPLWTNWLGTLMDRFDWLPDGAVIRAAYLLKTAQSRDTLGASLAAFKAAYGRGIPFYTAGLQHLVKGLYTFSETDADAKTMHASATTVAAHVDPGQTFTQITVLAPVT
jgi:hypothetical protein